MSLLLCAVGLGPFFENAGSEYYHTHDHLGYIGADPTATITAHNMYVPPAVFDFPRPPPQHYPQVCVWCRPSPSWCSHSPSWCNPSPSLVASTCQELLHSEPSQQPGQSGTALVPRGRARVCGFTAADTRTQSFHDTIFTTTLSRSLPGTHTHVRAHGCAHAHVCICLNLLGMHTCTCICLIS